MLSKAQLKDICLLHAPEAHQRCRYLAQDDNDYSKWYCVKKSASKKAEIDLEVAEHFDECKKRGQDPYQGQQPLGDHCEGYPIMKYIEQGFDQK